MKCRACEKNFSLNAWRVINLNPQVKTTLKPSALKPKNPITYYTVPGKKQYEQIYACPYCGTLRIRTPIDKF